MNAADRPAVPAPAEGFVLIDRTQRGDAPHPRYSAETGPALRSASTSVRSTTRRSTSPSRPRMGWSPGGSLHRFDAATKVGLVEPVRVDDKFQRRGLARAMLSAGIDRLVTRGAQRVKVSYETDAAAALYQGVESSGRRLHPLGMSRLSHTSVEPCLTT